MSTPTTTRTPTQTEKPMFFSAPMILALLQNIKSMTRRAVKPSAHMRKYVRETWGNRVPTDAEWNTMAGDAARTLIGQNDYSGCPHPPGSRMWVKEGVIQLGHERTCKNGQYRWPKFADEEKARRWFDSCCVYTADLKYDDPLYIEPHGTLNKLFMPRWASRITLEVVRVRVERVQDISEADAQAEGVAMGYWPCTFEGSNAPRPIGYAPMFRRIWDSINGKREGGKYAWAANPHVFVYEFRRLPASSSPSSPSPEVGK